MKQSRRGLLAGSQLEDRRSPRLQGRSAAKTVAAVAPAPLRSKDDDRRQTYVVKAGDSLWTIANKFSTTVEHLKRLNNLTGRRASELQVGQRLAVKDTES
jgi:LysM repeat protein